MNGHNDTAVMGIADPRRTRLLGV